MKIRDRYSDHHERISLLHTAPWTAVLIFLRQSRAVEVEAIASLSLSLKPSDCHESLSNAANGNG
jgi:hypothetical protein